MELQSGCRELHFDYPKLCMDHAEVRSKLGEMSD